MNYRGVNLLVTGGFGFIGSNFIHYLANNYHQDYFVLNVDNLSFAADQDNLQQINPNLSYQFRLGDVSDKAFMLELLREYRIDTIIHFAAESHVDRSITHPGVFVHSNVLGTYSLLEAARHYWLQQKNLTAEQCLFYHVSTDEVYGSLQASDPAFTEDSPYLPNSPYSATKAGSDHLVRAYSHTHGLPTIMSHCSNNYGPRQHREKLIPKIIESCLRNEPIPIYGDGSNIRDWLYVDDHCRAIHQLMLSGQRGQSYNIGGNQEKSNRQVVQEVCALLNQLRPSPHGDYQKLISFVPDRLGHDWRYAINSSKLQQQLNWSPQEDFVSGLRKTVEYYLKIISA
jgi:dTDP-glucose 4,6-dehydratase